MKLAVLLLTALALYYAYNQLYTKIWSRKAGAWLSFASDTVTEGDSNRLVEVVLNRKLLVIPALKVRFSCDRSLRFADTRNFAQTDKNYRTDLFLLMPYQKITRTLPFTCARRGFYTVREISMVTVNMLNGQTLVNNLPVSAELTVYPRKSALHGADLYFSRLAGEILSRRFAPADPFEFSGIREYQPYDGMRSVNWKATAKTGELMVNTYSPTTGQKVLIAADISSDTLWADDGLREECIRLAAGAADVFIRNGIPVGLECNGRDIVGGAPVTADFGCGRGHMQTLLHALARIDTAAPPLWRGDTAAGSDTVMLIISMSSSEKLRQRLAAGSGSAEIVWLRVFREGERPQDNPAGIKVLFQEVPK